MNNLPGQLGHEWRRCFYWRARDALALTILSLSAACGGSAPQSFAGGDLGGPTVPTGTEEIHCGLPIHPASHRLAKIALYVVPGYPGPQGPHHIAVAFALWDDGTLRWLPSLNPGEHRDYWEATLSAEQRLGLIQRLEKILEDLPRPEVLHLDPRMHSRDAYLVFFAGERGIALSRRFDTSAIDELFAPQPDEDAAAFVRLWMALAAELSATLDGAVGTSVSWPLPDVSWVTRKVSSRG